MHLFNRTRIVPWWLAHYLSLFLSFTVFGHSSYCCLVLRSLCLSHTHIHFCFKDPVMYAPPQHTHSLFYSTTWADPTPKTHTIMNTHSFHLLTWWATLTIPNHPVHNNPMAYFASLSGSFRFFSRRPFMTHQLYAFWSWLTCVTTTTASTRKRPCLLQTWIIIS